MTFITSIKELLGIRCKHFWRPAKLSEINANNFRNCYRPAKVCDDCGKVIVLSKEEFYAEFGRIADV